MSKKYDKFLRNEQWLYQKYKEENLNAQQIAKIIGCNSSTVLRSLRYLGIKVKNLSEIKKGIPRGSSFPELNNKDWLYQKYWTERLSTYEIANILNCFSSTIVRALKRERIVSRVCSEAHKPERHYLFGKHQSKEVKEKIRITKRGKSFSVEHKQKLCEARKYQKIPTHHTKPELIFEAICKKHNLPYKYTGDGSFWIGKNPSVNPDFVECNGKKIAIEIFSYWHDPLRRHCKVRYSATYEGRKKVLKKYGWKLIVFWESDLQGKTAETFVLATLQKEGII